ncbi:MAG: M20/M25/M40 family metallo-hydrolase, partial [Crocinitomicaceae bacterium]|nr:M20/M25/M40 family metallo-hydrolase [Crocinitomicaceae bacterium]
EAEMAVQWGKKIMEKHGFDKVYLQEIRVPHWERGTTESGWIENEKGEIYKLHILALGGSKGTNGTLSGEVIEFMSLDDLKKASESEVKGKIVFLNQPMDQKLINTFKAYGGCWPIRGNGAIEGGKLGAKAVIIRSLAIPTDDHPHTGSMKYDEGVDSIPSAAISTSDSDLLHNWLKKGKVNLHFHMDCRFYGMVKSHNVIGEITGSEKPNEIITIGGHLDSWDVGEGAHDDGAGIVHCLEAGRIFKALNYQPKHTIRVVFFMNEENGNFGGKSYALQAKKNNEMHVAAVESDRGGFSPRGFDIQNANPKSFKKFLETMKPLHDFELTRFKEGYGGVDIGPLKEVFPEIVLFGLVPDSQRYFDFHHAETDVFENVNKRELALGAAAMASFLFLLDSYYL